MNVPNVIVQRPNMFDVLCEHDPPGTLPGEDNTSSIRLQCWVKRIHASGPDEAGKKAQRFLFETRGLRNIEPVKWRYSRRPTAGQKGVKPRGNGTLLT